MIVASVVRIEKNGGEARVALPTMRPTTKKVIRKLREEALQHLSMIATTINFRTTNGDQLKTIVAYNKVDGIIRVLGERECEVLQFGPALPVLTRFRTTRLVLRHSTA